MKACTSTLVDFIVRNFLIRLILCNELLMQPGSYTKTYGDRAFAVHVPREWNLLPYEIRKSNTISSFKRSLKTYLFTKFSNNRSLFL